MLKRDSIRRECESSLRRLKVDTIDLYQIHWPEPDEDIEEGWETLARLKEEGKVRWIGVSNFNVAQLERCRAIAPITSLQPPYSAVSPEAQDAQLPYCQEHGIGVIVYSPMKSGVADRQDDARTGGGAAGRRFPPPRAGLPGTATHAQPGAGRSDEANRRPPRPWGGRSGHRVGAAPSGGHGCHRRHAERRTGPPGWWARWNSNCRRRRSRRSIRHAKRRTARRRQVIVLEFSSLCFRGRTPFRLLQYRPMAEIRQSGSTAPPNPENIRGGLRAGGFWVGEIGGKKMLTTNPSAVVEPAGMSQAAKTLVDRLTSSGSIQDLADQDSSEVAERPFASAIL